MSEATIIYAPNQAELGNVLKRVQQRDPRVVKAYIDICFMLYTQRDLRVYYVLVEQGMEEKNQLFQEFEDYCIMAGVKETLENLIFKNGFKIPASNAPLWQACMMALLTIEYLIVYDELNLRENAESTFFAGCSFGEFWALEYLAQKYPIMGILSAYKRGEAMSKAVGKGTTFFKMTLNTKEMNQEKVDLYKSKEFEKASRHWGKLILKNGITCFFGKRTELIEYARKFNVNLKENPIPFHSPYLFYAGNDFARLMGQDKFIGELGNTKAFISDRSSLYIPEVLAQEFYTPLDERKLLQTIEERVKAKGFDKCRFLRL